MTVQDTCAPHENVIVSSRATYPAADARWFTFRGKTLFYNRISYNNRAERIVEVPLAFDFLARHAHHGHILEIGNVLARYENALSDALGIRSRRIVDKFERGEGIENVDLMDLDAAEKYPTIVSVSTVEHVGQYCSPGGQFGERHLTRDREAPLKAIARIYDLLEVGGRAFLTVPFGALTDGGWYIQFSSAYLDLLTSSYGIPRDALSVSFLKWVKREAGWRNPHQCWVEAEEESLRNTRYSNMLYWCGARAIAVIELTRLAAPFTLNLDVPPAPLRYEQSRMVKYLLAVSGLALGWLG